MWSYKEAISWLYARQALGIKLGLDKVERLLAKLGNPHHGFSIVHVAGTNGKGSVTTMLADVLQRSGHRTGYTISPHLTRFTERAVVDGIEITQDQAATILAQIRDVVATMEDEAPTFFEIVTALAFIHFSQQKVDWAVIETGLGGRLDATNVCTPELTIITNVEMDHVAMLGESLHEIAAEKAGIMKPGVPCVTGASGVPLQVIKAHSHALQVPMSVIGEDYIMQPDVNGLRLLHPGGDAHYDVQMAGAHQLQNAAIVVAAADALRIKGHEINRGAVAQALSQWSMPGRLEHRTIEGPNGRVEILLDGAHNEAGAVALRNHLAAKDWAGFHLITGFQGDKDWSHILRQWVPITSRGWGVPLRSPRTLNPESMADAFGIIPFATAPTCQAAIEGALERGAKQIVVAGSLWLVGEARAYLDGEELEEFYGSQ